MISYTASIEWSVTCARCRVRTILSAFVVGPRDEIPWPSLLDGWRTLEELPPFKTYVQVEKPRKIISRNESPASQLTLIFHQILILLRTTSACLKPNAG